MKVYLAGMYSKRNLLREYSQELRAKGIVVSSQWLLEQLSLKAKSTGLPKEFMRFAATQDKSGIRECDTFILFTATDADLSEVGRSIKELRRLARAAHEWECGYAHALGKRIIIVGQKMNIFHYDTKYEVYRTWRACKRHLTN